RIIPYRGSWLDFEFDAKDIVYARIDRRRKIPATIVLRALGMSNQEILDTFYDKITYKKSKKGWSTAFNPETYKGIKIASDLVDAKTGKIVADDGNNLTQLKSRKLHEDVLNELLVNVKVLATHYAATDNVNPKTCEVLLEAGDNFTPAVLASLDELGIGS